KGAVWKRIVVFLSSIPVTIIMNSARIGTIGLMVEHWGISMAEGFLHEFQGWVVFMLRAVLRRAEIVPGRAGFAEFPMRLGAWLGHRESLEGIYLDQLKLDDYLLADYV